jgi:hypothetical protein
LLSLSRVVTHVGAWCKDRQHASGNKKRPGRVTGGKSCVNKAVAECLAKLLKKEARPVCELGLDSRGPRTLQHRHVMLIDLVRWRVALLRRRRPQPGGAISVTKNVPSVARIRKRCVGGLGLVGLPPSLRLD